MDGYVDLCALDIPVDPRAEVIDLHDFCTVFVMVVRSPGVEKPERAPR